MRQLYSERIQQNVEDLDVFVYEGIPTAFRNQLFFIIYDVANTVMKQDWGNLWNEIHNLFCREKGLKEMDESYGTSAHKIEKFIDGASDIDLLDFIDFVFHLFDTVLRDAYRYNPCVKISKVVDGAIAELNYRFRQNKLGYEFVNGEIIRIDNELIHSEYIKPVLRLLHTPGFEGAEQEFMKAFEALRQQNTKSAIIEAEKAFESVLKAICSKNGYPFDPERDTAKKLISILKDNSYFPTYMEDHLSTIAKALENGAPTMRNRTSGHGQGEDVVFVPDNYVDYVIGLVAVNILFLSSLLPNK